MKKQRQTVEQSHRMTSVIFMMIILIALITACANGSISFDDNDVYTDDGCNDMWIEQDYNGDGEEDAEDFRIQQELCE